MIVKYYLSQDSFELKIPTSLERCTIKYKMPKTAFSQERDDGH